ncbi:hypothetical protein PAAG_01637 [Paracoccidioides lutzii Pb01]|uniref:C2H2 finger domain-containing protein n=1 Tax=Paracoccidioides lutzii (strain ATCC MYA-826 / Pb01) TaxID=502779 RepID=C1GSZ2_PARBA|nr:hypothetical protein PAAG_01637 [Paracoccidioides lutzii Pb01]EEH39175.1 hypothetical protein PAAG_01637 [Paracoccidioides lutzii Pb01]
MADIMFSHGIDELPQIRVSEDGPLSDQHSISPNSTDLPLMIDPASYSYDIDSANLRHDSIAARTSYMEARLSYLGKSMNGYALCPPTVENSQGGFYTLSSSTGQHGDDGEPELFHSPSWRYDSPSGSCGGDQTEADSSLSEQSWSHIHVYRQSQCAANYSPVSSTLSESFHHVEPSNSLSQNADGSYCGSEYSVSLREVQHYPDPDPDPEADPNFEMEIGLHGRSFTFHQYLSQGNTFLEVMEPAHADTNGQELRALAGGIDGQMESPMSKVGANQTPTEAPGDSQFPRKKMKTPIAIPPSMPRPQKSTTNNRDKPARPRAIPSRSSKRGSKVKSTRRSSLSPHLRQSNNDRQFICVFTPYGCTSTFSTKNEWKRHVSSQHLRLGFYRCDVGSCMVSHPPLLPLSSSSSSSSTRDRPDPPPQYPPRSPNDFNRKDLFTQHHRRMHSPWAVPEAKAPTKEEQEAFDKSLEKVRKRCWIERRKPPQRSQCNFCGLEFSGIYCWDERMEHVGKHYEKGDKEIGQDVALREWAVSEGIIVEGDGSGIWILASVKETVERLKSQEKFGIRNSF